MERLFEINCYLGTCIYSLTDFIVDGCFYAIKEVVKFGFVLAFVYLFAFCIFYMWDHNIPFPTPIQIFEILTSGPTILAPTLTAFSPRQSVNTPRDSTAIKPYVLETEAENRRDSIKDSIKRDSKASANSARDSTAIKPYALEPESESRRDSIRETVKEAIKRMSKASSNSARSSQAMDAEKKETSPSDSTAIKPYPYVIEIPEAENVGQAIIPIDNDTEDEKYVEKEEEIDTENETEADKGKDEDEDEDEDKEKEKRRSGTSMEIVNF